MAEALLDSSGGRTNAGTDECCSSASIIATALTILTMVMLLTGYDDDDGTDDGDAYGDDRASRGFVLAAPPDVFCLPEARPGVESRPRDFDPEPDAVSRSSSQDGSVLQLKQSYIVSQYWYTTCPVF